MPIANKVLLAAALVVSSTSLTLAQGFNPNLGSGVSGTRLLLPAAPFESAMVGLHARPYRAVRSAPRFYRRAHYGAFRTAPAALNIPPPSVVGPDNYQYWRQACCF